MKIKLMKNKTIFLTGATGFVGSYLLKIFIQNGYKVYAISRGKIGKSARTRVIDAVKFWDKMLAGNIRQNLVVFNGDITKVNFGLNRYDIRRLTDRIEEIYHCAANTDFSAPIKQARDVNVTGTKNILEFAANCAKHGKLQKVNYISTAFICGNYKGSFDENCMDTGQKFNTTYEQSKFEAELLVSKYRRKGLWVNIFRPPAIIGESKTGKTPTFNQTFYQVLHVWNSGALDSFPQNKRLRIKGVCVDELCRSVLEIANNVFVENGNYHTFPVDGFALTELLKSAQNILGFKKIKTVNMNEFMKNSTWAQKMLLRYNLFFINDKVRLCSEKTNEILGELNFKYSRMDGKLLNTIMLYPKVTGFGANNRTTKSRKVRR